MDVLVEQDCIAPPAPNLESPVADAFVTSNEFNFSWQAVDDPSGVSYRICVADTSSFAGAQCSEQLTETSYAASGLVTDESQTKYWHVIARDGAGNEENWSETRKFTIDKELPEVTFNGSPLLVGGNTPTSTLTGSVSDANLTSYGVTITDPTAATTTVPSESVTGETSDLTYIFDVTGRESGTYIVTLTATDAAGQASHVDVSIEVDNSGPELTIEGSRIVKSGSITPEVTATDPRNIASYQWEDGPSNPGAIIYNNTFEEPEFTPTVEGSYQFLLTVKDDLGNTTTKPFEFGYARELEGLPLPTTNTPESPAPESILPAAISPTANQTRDPRENTDDQDGEVAQVLGTTTSTEGVPMNTRAVAALTPTNDGWKIMGILWYWWLIAIAVVVAAWAVLKKFFTPKTS